ncbi:josephin protein [Trifolium repens]|nr:josephin protein [Trifolium repens]
MSNTKIQELPYFLGITKTFRRRKITIQIIPNPINLPQSNPMSTFPNPSKSFHKNINHNPHQNIFWCIKINR